MSRHHATRYVGYLRYIEPDEPPPPGETDTERLKRTLKALPPGAFADPKYLVAALKRAKRRI